MGQGRSRLCGLSEHSIVDLIEIAPGAEHVQKIVISAKHEGIFDYDTRIRQRVFGAIVSRASPQWSEKATRGALSAIPLIEDESFYVGQLVNAAGDGLPNVCSVLLDLFGPQIRANLGDRSPLVAALIQGSRKTAELLAAHHGLTNPTFRDNLGRGEIHYAAAAHALHVVRSILADAQGQETAKDSMGQIPLHYACAYVKGGAVPLSTVVVVSELYPRPTTKEIVLLIEDLWPDRGSQNAWENYQNDRGFTPRQMYLMARREKREALWRCEQELNRRREFSQRRRYLMIESASARTQRAPVAVARPSPKTPEAKRATQAARAADEEAVTERKRAEAAAHEAEQKAKELAAAKLKADEMERERAKRQQMAADKRALQAMERAQEAERAAAEARREQAAAEARREQAAAEARREQAAAEARREQAAAEARREQAAAEARREQAAAEPRPARPRRLTRAERMQREQLRRTYLERIQKAEENLSRARRTGDRALIQRREEEVEAISRESLKAFSRGEKFAGGDFFYV